MIYLKQLPLPCHVYVTQLRFKDTLQPKDQTKRIHCFNAKHSFSAVSTKSVYNCCCWKSQSSVCLANIRELSKSVQYLHRAVVEPYGRHVCPIHSQQPV